ncbi:uncharacterized protein L201_002605 [Kwoniella dendrophila CBS 6074]|uniref:Wax synthase domain-containing protein n=1 Tax=Kwoniella dendrophila CBS 6074 TaxID=1295534 RepID=A0AAX4JS29_9TREE
MISIPFFSSSSPFGPLQGLHEYVIENAVGISWQNWYHLFVIPLVPLYGQALLLRSENTRLYRIAVGTVGISLIGRAVTNYRFTQPWFNGLNNGIGIGVMHVIARYIEFAFIDGPVVDRYLEAKGRHPLINALSVAMGARWIGMGSIDLDKDSKVHSGNVNKQRIRKASEEPENDDLIIPSKEDTDVVDGGFEFSNPKNRSKNIPDIKKSKKAKDSWLPWPKIKRTKFESLTRHLWITIRNYVIFDTFLYLIRYFGSETIGSDLPVKNALYRFTHENTFYILPILKQYGFSPIKVHWFLVDIMISMNVATGVWLGIAMGYHLFAFLTIITNLFEVENWEIDIFDSPFMGDSLLDIWGKRWHQFFRHHFILYSTIFLRLFRIPTKSGNIMVMSFLLSGLMHSFGQYTMSPNPPLIPLFLLFPISGLFGFMEITFKKFTGKKVEGIYGRIWTWIIMLSIGRLGTKAWLESGVGGTLMTPPLVGEYITKNFLEAYLIAKG